MQFLGAQARKIVDSIFARPVVPAREDFTRYLVEFLGTVVGSVLAVVLNVNF
jgi:hypothetical protein